jgi:hypothetical protein
VEIRLGIVIGIEPLMRMYVCDCDFQRQFARPPIHAREKLFRGILSGHDQVLSIAVDIIIARVNHQRLVFTANHFFSGGFDCVNSQSPTVAIA